MKKPNKELILEALKNGEELLAMELRNKIKQFKNVQPAYVYHLLYDLEDAGKIKRIRIGRGQGQSKWSLK